MGTRISTGTPAGDPNETLRPDDGLPAAAAHYERWGWLVLRTDDRLLLTTNHCVGAVELPADVAADVQRFLAVRMLAGPVVALPGAPCRWLLLTDSADDATQVNLVRLVARGGVTHRRGTLVPLPPSRLDSGVVRWQVPPSLDGPSLPPFTAVVSAARAVTELA